LFQLNPQVALYNSCKIVVVIVVIVSGLVIGLHSASWFKGNNTLEVQSWMKKEWGQRVFFPGFVERKGIQLVKTCVTYMQRCCSKTNRGRGLTGIG